MRFRSMTSTSHGVSNVSNNLIGILILCMLRMVFLCIFIHDASLCSYELADLSSPA